MRVALVTNNVLPPREGIGRHVVELAKRLPALGVDPVIVAKGPSLRKWERLEIEGVEVALYPYLPIRPFHQEAVRTVLQPWLDGGADGAELLHLHLPLLPRIKTSLPRLVTFHSPLLADTAAINEPGMLSAMVKANARLFGQAYEHAQIKAAAGIIAVSGNVRSELQRLYRLGQHRPTVIENGVDTDFFTPEGRRPATAPRILLYAGRLGFRKGLTRLLLAFWRIARRLDLVLEIAGEGSLRGKLEAQAKALGIDERVRFLGFLERESLRQALHRASLVVNPAEYESGPLTLLEAMAAGAPVVTTPTGLVGDLSTPAPLVICERDPALMALAIESALAGPAAAAERAEAARRLVVERFAWDSVAARTAELYRLHERCAA